MKIWATENRVSRGFRTAPDVGCKGVRDQCITSKEALISEGQGSWKIEQFNGCWAFPENPCPQGLRNPEYRGGQVQNTAWDLSGVEEKCEVETRKSLTGTAQPNNCFRLNLWDQEVSCWYQIKDVRGHPVEIPRIPFEYTRQKIYNVSSINLQPR